MAKKKEGLPDKSVDQGEIVDKAKIATDARSKVAEFTTIEKKASLEIGVLAEEIRKDEVTRDNFIGIIRITDKELPPVRVEFRMERGLPIEEGPNLDAIYGAARPLLFKLEKIVKGITDPQGLINELVAEGKNPFDYLEVTVKKGMDQALVESEHVITDSGYLPVEGFLNTCADVLKTVEQKQYTAAFLEGALKPRVILGTKG